MIVARLGTAWRHWPEATKRRLVTETRMAGASVAAVARRNDVSPGLLYAWRRQFGAAVDAGQLALALDDASVAIETRPGGARAGEDRAGLRRGGGRRAVGSPIPGQE